MRNIGDSVDWWDVGMMGIIVVGSVLFVWFAIGEPVQEIKELINYYKA